MTNEFFLTVFIPLALIDWWMTKVQRTTQLICRASRIEMSAMGPYLNPPFVRLAFPVTLLKWGLVAYFAWASSAGVAISALVLSWVANISPPMPVSLILPYIERQVARVSAVDAVVGDALGQAVTAWVAGNSVRPTDQSTVVRPEVDTPDQPNSAPPTAEVQCPECQQRLRVPTGKVLMITCTRCRKQFTQAT